MNKPIIGVLLLLALGVAIFTLSNGVGVRGENKPRDFTYPAPELLPLPAFSIPFGNELGINEAWTTFQEYLAYSQVHDLEGVRSLSYQISAICENEATRAECNERMDNVYAIGSRFVKEDFKNITTDNRQAIIYTDGPERKILYFARDPESDSLKLLGIRFCYADEYVYDVCVTPEEYKEDSNENGWWNSIETLFYPEEAS